MCPVPRVPTWARTVPYAHTHAYRRSVPLNASRTCNGLPVSSKCLLLMSCWLIGQATMLPSDAAPVLPLGFGNILHTSGKARM